MSEWVKVTEIVHVPGTKKCRETPIEINTDAFERRYEQNGEQGSFWVPRNENNSLLHVKETIDDIYPQLRGRRSPCYRRENGGDK